MKKLNYLITLIILAFAGITKSQCPVDFHDFWAKDIHGDSLNMKAFLGKKVLVVNTACF